MRSILLSAALCLSTFAACGAPTEEEVASSEPAIGSSTAAAVVTCPSPKSCGSWSSWYNIGSPTCVSNVADCAVEICRPCHCNIDSCDTCCTVRPRSGSFQTQESFRDCRLQNGSLCREKREQSVLMSCGTC